jgi:hypothetical protein
LTHAATLNIHSMVLNPGANIMITQRLVTFLGFGLAALAFVTVQGFAIERLFLNALAY